MAPETTSSRVPEDDHTQAPSWSTTSSETGGTMGPSAGEVVVEGCVVGVDVGVDGSGTLGDDVVVTGRVVEGGGDSGVATLVVVGAAGVGDPVSAQPAISRRPPRST